MTITSNQLQEWRHLAEHTMMISALGEYTPEEFTELLDYTEQLIAERDAALRVVDAAQGWATANQSVTMFYYEQDRDLLNAVRECEAAQPKEKQA